jgi:hypothetical protein
LYGSEAWSFTLREDHGVRVFQNRVLRKIFGPKKDNVIEKWRNYITRRFNDLNSSLNNIRVEEEE